MLEDGNFLKRRSTLNVTEREMGTLCVAVVWSTLLESLKFLVSRNISNLIIYFITKLSMLLYFIFYHTLSHFTLIHHTYSLCESKLRHDTVVMCYALALGSPHNLIVCFSCTYMHSMKSYNNKERERERE